jgi:hypothetical protein
MSCSRKTLDSGLLTSAWFDLRVGMKKKIKIVVLAGCAVVLSYCAAYPIYERWRATKLIEEIAQLKPGATTESQVREALHSYRPGTEQLVTTHWDVTSNQTIRATGYGYRFANTELSRLHLAKPAALNVSLFFRDGVLELKMVSLQVGSGTCCLVLVKEADKALDESPQNGGSMSVDKRGDPASEIIVNLRFDASDEERRRAYRLNLRCLSSTSDCDSANSLSLGL